MDNNNNSDNNNSNNENKNSLFGLYNKVNNYLFNKNENHKDSASSDLNKNINNSSNNNNSDNGNNNKSNSSSSPTYLNQMTNYLYNIIGNKKIEPNNEPINNNKNNINNVESKESYFIDLFKKKQHEIEDKFEQINEVINDESNDDATAIKKTIDILGRRRFYEILFLFGSASIISFALRTLYFGKTIRAIEIPDGNLTTLVLRSNSVKRLKKTILQNQPPIYPGVELNAEDIKASIFIDPHFTEPIVTNRDVRRIDDGGYVLWTKSDFEIPRTAVGLKSLMKDRDLFLRFSTDAEVDKLVRLISLFGPSLILKPQSPFKKFLLKHKLIQPSDLDLLYQDKDEPLTIKK
ncbi:hypothetical protein DICPUDRAFT_32436, partial [Dictyostelium purpureum]